MAYIFFHHVYKFKTNFATNAQREKRGSRVEKKIQE